jgi:anaerobic ribonucleoside-triphosphate reductase activating protein
MKIRLASEIQTDSIVDGEGIRTVVWTQGCKHNCPGCHNPETHCFDKGTLVELEDLKEQILSVKNQDGVTLSGGDPMFQPEASAEIAKFCQENGLNVWCYTGFKVEELLKTAETNANLKTLLQNIDVLVDGKFKQEEKSLNLYFKGSKNQRVLDMKETLKQQKAVEIQKYKGIRTFEPYNNTRNINKGIFI